MAATEARIALVSQPFRYAALKDSQVTAIVPTADSHTAPGYFSSASDAQAINGAAFALLGDVSRAIREIDVPGALSVSYDGLPPMIRGDDVEGLVDGRDYLVLAHRSDGRMTTLTIWG